VDFDGGARNNPGVGGSGSLLLLVRGGACSVLARRADFLGDHVTNNFAEFSGMASGLQLALDFLAQSAEPTPGLRLTVTGDSELVVQAMLARREVRDPALTALAAQADELCEQLEARGCTVDFTHVRRALNGEADKLANEAMDAKDSKLTRAADFAAAHIVLPLPEADDEDEPDEPGPAARSGRIPLLTALPSREQLHAWLAEVHRDSRVLSRLPPSKLWPAHTTLAWTSACARFTAQLAAALDSACELALTQALLDLIELPAAVLRGHCPGLRPEDVKRALAGQAAAAAAARGSPPDSHPDPPGAARSGDPRVRRAERLAYTDRADKAMQEVLSNGCAAPTQAICDILRDMHPAG
jgi:ribonuclease HI